MLKNWLLSGILVAASFVGGSCESQANPLRVKKTLTPFSGQLVTYESTLSFNDVITRLDLAVNKTGSEGFATHFNGMKSHDEMVAYINSVTGGVRDFVYFGTTPHSEWLDIYDPSTHHPNAIVYTIGNPIVAAGIIPLDYRAGLDIPPRAIILEKPDGTGTQIVYQLCASVFSPGNHNPVLNQRNRDLDTKLDAMFTQVMSN